MTRKEAFNRIDAIIAKPVIHRFDTEKEAEFFKSQVAHGEMLPWGEKEVLTQ